MEDSPGGGLKFGPGRKTYIGPGGSLILPMVEMFSYIP